MAPIRRYLRITKHSVLEVRIYLERPSDAESWLLRRDNPALPRIIQAVRPRVLPKLREENERARGKSKGKKRGIKDMVIEDDFEVSIFLTELSSRHSLLTKQKTFKDKPRLKSNSGKLTGWLTAGTNEEPVIISDDSNEPRILREEDEAEMIDLDQIPEVAGAAVLVGEEDGHDFAQFSAAGDKAPLDTESDTQDDKKLRMRTSYEGFSIYGRILCLVVKRKGPRTLAGGSGVPPSSQKMLENWVSTQAVAEAGEDDDEDQG